MCDTAVSWNGWYRLFIQGQSIRMPDTCVDRYSCGTDAPLWLNGGHPTVKDGVVTRNVCGHWSNNCCYFQSNPIKVKACPGGYYVYEFVSPITCNLAYCADSSHIKTTNNTVMPEITTTETTTTETTLMDTTTDAPVPNITVFRQMQDREHVMVMCSFGRRFNESSFQLSVKGEHNYTLKYPLCYSNEKCVFDVKVSSSVSFTCVHKINHAVNQQSETYTYSPSAQPSNMSTPYYKTQTAQNPITSTPYYKTQKAQNPITCTPCYKTQKAQNPITSTPCYETQILNQHEEGVSSFYIGFFCFIVVGLVIMTAAVIMTTLKSNVKGSVITETENDYTNI